MKCIGLRIIKHQKFKIKNDRRKKIDMINLPFKHFINVWVCV